MKKFLTLLALVLCALVASAQKGTVGYSFVIKDASGDLVADRDVKVRVLVSTKTVIENLLANKIAIEGTIAKGSVYCGIYEVKTDKNGVASISIGSVESPSGYKKRTLADFDFDFAYSTEYAMIVEIDPDGNGYSIKGSSVFTSVPMALNAMKANKATTADNVTSLGDMPMTTLNVKVVNPTSSKVDVSILGQNITGNDTKSFSVPAYCPTFLSVDINESAVKYTVKLNGEEIASETGSYQKSDTYSRRVFDTGLASNTHEYDLSKAVFEYYPVMDNAEGDKSGRYCANDKKLLNNTDCRNYQTASNYTVSASYENNVYIEGQAEIQASDKWMGYADLNLRHWKSGDKTFPLYVKIPSFSYKNTFTQTPIYKHGYDNGFFFKNMKNEVIGPFPDKTNTLVIEVIAIVK